MIFYHFKVNKVGRYHLGMTFNLPRWQDPCRPCKTGMRDSFSSPGLKTAEENIPHRKCIIIYALKLRLQPTHQFFQASVLKGVYKACSLNGFCEIFVFRCV